MGRSLRPGAAVRRVYARFSSVTRHTQYVIRKQTILLLACAPLFGQQYTISTVAGASAGAPLTNPTSVVVDASGNIYVGDWSGFIHKFWSRNGAVTTVAGTGVLGYSGDGGQATNAQIGRSINLALDGAGNLYIADGANNRIRRVELSTGIITTVTNAVTNPTGITVDTEGNLYFSSGWSQVKKWTAATGAIQTLGGQVVNGFSGDNGPAANALFWDPVPGAVNGAGDVYLADFENSRIRRIAARTGTVNTIVGTGACPVGLPPLNITVCQGGFGGDGGPAENATLNYAEAVALDASGNLYIADTINHQIRRVDATTGFIYTIAGNGVNGLSGDGGPATAAEMTFPVGLAVDAGGRVYFADESNNCIRVLTPTVTAQPDRLRQRPRP